MSGVVYDPDTHGVFIDPDPNDGHPVRVAMPEVNHWFTLEAVADVRSMFAGYLDAIDEAVARVTAAREAGVTDLTPPEGEPS